MAISLAVSRQARNSPDTRFFFFFFEKAPFAVSEITFLDPTPTRRLTAACPQDDSVQKAENQDLLFFFFNSPKFLFPPPQKVTVALQANTPSEAEEPLSSRAGGRQDLLLPCPPNQCLVKTPPAFKGPAGRAPGAVTLAGVTCRASGRSPQPSVSAPHALRRPLHPSLPDSEHPCPLPPRGAPQLAGQRWSSFQALSLLQSLFLPRSPSLTVPQRPERTPPLGSQLSPRAG